MANAVGGLVVRDLGQQDSSLEFKYLLTIECVGVYLLLVVMGVRVCPFPLCIFFLPKKIVLICVY